MAALDVVHGHDDVVGDPYRLVAERFRLLGHVGDQSRRGILPAMRETNPKLHIETRAYTHGTRAQAADVSPSITLPFWSSPGDRRGVPRDRDVCRTLVTRADPGAKRQIAGMKRLVPALPLHQC